MLCSLSQGKQYKFLVIYTYITYIYILSVTDTKGIGPLLIGAPCLGSCTCLEVKGRERILPGSRAGTPAEPELAMLGKHRIATRDCRG